MEHRVGKLLVAGWFACLGCSGGQTGDGGTSGGFGDPCTVAQAETSIEAVEATGFPLGPWLDRTFGSAGRLEWDLEVLLPRAFFERRGLSYPALDPSTRAHVVLSPSGSAQMLLAAPNVAQTENPYCVDQARVTMSIEIQFPELGETQTGLGSFTVDAAGTVLNQSLSLGEIGEDCGLMLPSALNDPSQVYCNSRFGGEISDGIIGTNQCAAPATWPKVPVEPTTGQSWAALFERPEVRQPVPLSCRKPDGSMARLLTASVSLEVADRACDVFYTRAAAGLQLSTGETFEGLGATLAPKNEACSTDPVRWDPATGPEPVVPRCPAFVVHLENPTVNSELVMQLVLQDNGAQTVRVDYFDPRYKWGSETPVPYEYCSGRLEIPAAP